MTPIKTVRDTNYENDFQFLRSDKKKRNYSYDEIVSALEKKRKQKSK